MALIPLSPTESGYIQARIVAFDKEVAENQRWQSPFVAQFRAIPLYLGWTETIGIRPDGTFIRWSTEGDFEGAREVEDPVWVRIAIVEGAKKYPLLKSLIPARPPKARTCSHCQGKGFIPANPKIICACGGVGWIDADETEQLSG